MKLLCGYLFLLIFCLIGCRNSSDEDLTKTEQASLRKPPLWNPTYGMWDVDPDKMRIELGKLKNAGFTKVEIAAWFSYSAALIRSQLQILNNCGFDNNLALVPIHPRRIAWVTDNDPINIGIIKAYIDSVMYTGTDRPNKPGKYFVIDEPQWLNISNFIPEYHGHMPPEVITRIGQYINSKNGYLYIVDPVSNTGNPSTVYYNSYYTTACKVMLDRYNTNLPERNSDYRYTKQYKDIAPIIGTMWVPNISQPTIPKSVDYYNGINNARDLTNEVWFYTIKTEDPKVNGVTYELFNPESRWNDLLIAISNIRNPFE